MTIKNSLTGFIVHCDECPEDIETEEENFDLARNMAAAAGWRAFMGPDKKWANSCPACIETFRHSKKGRS